LKRVFSRIGRFFLQGLLVFAPIASTVYLVYIFIRWMDGFVERFFGYYFPGFGFLAIAIFITLLGVVSSFFFIRPFIRFFEELVKRTPLVKIVYSSIRDLLSAFVSDERKFDKPIIVKLTDDGPYRLGFLTDDDLSNLGLTDLVSVYLPHSYNFSGNLFLLPRRHIRRLNGINSTDLMKYIVSGGVTKLVADGKVEEF